MFTGYEIRKIDSKNRLVLPKSYIVENSPIFLTPRKDDLEQTYLYGSLEKTIKEIISIQSPLTSRPIIKIQPDINSRIILPRYLLNLITNNNQIIIIGQGNHFSLYSPKNAENLIQNIENIN